ncbi:MAG: sulfurtransferase TusA family protein [Eubacteriales bacterium]
MYNIKVLNLYGEKCSTIISRVTKQIEQMKQGDSVVIKTDNICACKKIPDWCRKNNYQIGIQKVDKNCMNFTIRVK